MTIPQIAVVAAFGLMTVIGFVLMGVDKSRAKRDKWRVRESTLIASAFLFGGVGALLGMLTFRHKTKHIKFIILVPVGAIISVVALILPFVL